jgi:hypothetical protein
LAEEQITDIFAVVGALITIPMALQITQVLRNTAHKEVHVFFPCFIGGYMSPIIFSSREFRLSLICFER